MSLLVSLVLWWYFKMFHLCGTSSCIQWQICIVHGLMKTSYHFIPTTMVISDFSGSQYSLWFAVFIILQLFVCGHFYLGVCRTKFCRNYHQTPRAAISYCSTCTIIDLVDWLNRCMCDHWILCALIPCTKISLLLLAALVI